MSRTRASIAAALLALCWHLAPSPAAAADIDFYRDVYPILKSNCIACHNKTTSKAALNMETPELMRKGGDSGDGLVPGKGEESLIYQAAAHLGGVEMPPKGNKSGASNLKPDELALLKGWIDQGAKRSVQQARQVVWQPLAPGVHPIYAAALTPDGRLAACGRANQVFVYDLATRQLVTRLADPALDTAGSPAVTGLAHRAIVQSLAFSPDGMRLASGGYRDVKIWRKAPTAPAWRAAELKLATKIAGGVTLFSLSPDATHAAVVGADASLSVWNLASGQRTAAQDHVTGVRALAWLPDGRTIAAAGDDKAVRLWNLPKEGQGELTTAQELTGAAAPVTALACGAGLLVAASADGKIRMWTLPDYKPGRELPVAGASALALSTDASRLAVGRADGNVQVWDLAAGKAVIDLTGDAETNAHLAAIDGTVAAEGLEMSHQTQEAARIEAQNKALDGLLTKANDTIATVKKDLTEKQNSLKQASAAREAAQKAEAEAAANSAKAPADKPDPALEKAHKDAQDKLNAAVLAESGAQDALKARQIHLHDAEVEAGNYTAAQDRNKRAIADANTARDNAKVAQAKAVAESAALKKAVSARNVPATAVRFAADGQTIAAALGDGSIRVWAVASGLPIEHRAPGKETTGAALAANPNGGFIACTADGATAHVATESRWVLERVLGGATADSPFADRVNALRFSPDGKTLAAGSGELTRSGDISLWNVADGKLVAEWKERHSDAVLSLDFSADGQRLASGGADKVARVTEIASGKVLNVFEGHTHHVLGVSFRSDGRILATAGADGAVVVWDLISGERKRKIEGWGKEVTSLQFIGATNQILTSSGANLVRIVDDNGGQVRAMPALPDFVQSAASAANASVIIGGGEDGLLHIWNGTNGQELAQYGAGPNANSPSAQPNPGVR